MPMEAAYQYALAKRLCQAETQGKGAWHALNPQQREPIEKSVDEAVKRFFAITGMNDTAISKLDAWEDENGLIAETKGKQWRIIVRGRDEQEILLRWESVEPLNFDSFGWDWYGIACSTDFRVELDGLSFLLEEQEKKKKVLEALLMEIHYAYLHNMNAWPKEEPMVERLWQTLYRSVLTRETDKPKVITIFPKAVTAKPTCLQMLRIIEGEEPEAEIQMDNGWAFRLRAEIKPVAGEWGREDDFRIQVRFSNRDGKLPFVPAIEFREQ